jgi:hypothetical protein
MPLRQTTFGLKRYALAVTAGEYRLGQNSEKFLLRIVEAAATAGPVSLPGKNRSRLT